jgi:hypothetical protein
LWSLEKFLPVNEFLARYCELAGVTVTAEHFLFWRLFNEVKHSIISLTAARSFNDGRTRNIVTRTARRPSPPTSHVHGVVAMIYPTMSELLSGVASSLDETVLPELAPGSARNQLVAAIALIRRSATVGEAIRAPSLWEGQPSDIDRVSCRGRAARRSIHRRPMSTPGYPRSTSCGGATSRCNIAWSPYTTRSARRGSCASATSGRQRGL